MSIAANLGRLAACNQFFVYRLSEWSATENKWKRKQPWSLKYDNNIKPQMSYNWMSYDAALAAVMRQPVTPGVAWCVGMWITESLGMFFLDIDKLPADYTTTPEANALLARFPGCMVEWSSSRRGVHVIGSRTADIDHCNESPPLELYTDERGIALATSAQGCADTDGTEAFATLVTERFPPKPRAAPAGPIMPPVPGAPADLSALSLVLRQADRIKRAPPGERNATLNGAAFVVGGMVGAGRISRDDARSALIAAVDSAGWGEMDVQVRKIDQALDSGTQEPIVAGGVLMPAVATPGVPDVPAADASAPVSPVESDPNGMDWTDLIDQAKARIENSGTYKELMNVVVPEIQAMNIPHQWSARVVNCLYKRLEIFDAKNSISVVRQMVNPPARATLADTTPPDWFAPFCYARRTETYYNTVTGTHFSPEDFRVEFTRYMPLKPNNAVGREDPVLWARERWNIVTVDDTMYRPDCGAFFDWSNRQYANEFIPSTLPHPTAASEHTSMCIQAFQDHLYLMCGRRDDVYRELLGWIAHNVQRPGYKIRWSPIIKGVPGDGKSIVSDLMRAALGMSNVKMTSISNLSNSGGFTDWAHGSAVNFIEEIHLTGKERYKIFNAIKPYITDNFIDINRKGRPSGDTVFNVTNHWANTNYGDALPIDDGDRRWCVIFTPYDSIAEVVAAKGLPSPDSLVNHFKMLGASMRAEPGAWRGWLLGIDLSSFNPDGRAPDTSEKGEMMLMSQDALDQAVIDVLELGGHGITKDAFSSKNVMGAVEMRSGEKPATRTWNALLARLGYRQHGKMVWWSGTSHRVWVRRSMTAEQIKEILDSSIKLPIKSG